MGVNGTSVQHDDGPSVALLDKFCALGKLSRLGALRTPDLRATIFEAQVLKCNRTLKVFNLRDGKSPNPSGMNLCLEKLDLSKNPHSAALDGIQSLRTVLTLNTALERLFLSSPQLTSTGAIALADFFPKSALLVHSDLTVNAVDLAGVMALSNGSPIGSKFPSVRTQPYHAT